MKPGSRLLLLVCLLPIAAGCQSRGLSTNLTFDCRAETDGTLVTGHCLAKDNTQIVNDAVAAWSATIGSTPSVFRIDSAGLAIIGQSWSAVADQGVDLRLVAGATDIAVGTGKIRPANELQQFQVGPGGGDVPGISSVPFALTAGLGPIGLTALQNGDWELKVRSSFPSSLKPETKFVLYMIAHGDLR